MIPVSASASGKIILSGEYAVLFGKKGIAIPSIQRMHITWEKNPAYPEVKIVWADEQPSQEWILYIQKILHALQAYVDIERGALTVNNFLPLGKGMGSSTACIIAICRAIVGVDCETIALNIENLLNPGNSGIDFSVIWKEKPIVFQKNHPPQSINIDVARFQHSTLIDTGNPHETTKELVAWMYAKESDIQGAIQTIGHCTDRILAGEPIATVMKDHHRAQVALGVVPAKTQKIIADIEAQGGSAKVIGAGGRTGGGGMVLIV